MFDNGSMPTVKVFSVSATGTEVDTLTAPSNPANGEGNVTFTASSGVTLTANTKYWIVAEGGTSSWTRTDDGTDDAGSAAGWSIADKYGRRDPSQTGNFTDRNNTALKLSVNGTEKTPGNSTGKPSITGAAVVGQTLTAATSTIADPGRLAEHLHLAVDTGRRADRDRHFVRDLEHLHPGSPPTRARRSR